MQFSISPGYLPSPPVLLTTHIYSWFYANVWCADVLATSSTPSADFISILSNIKGQELSLIKSDVSE